MTTINSNRRSSIPAIPVFVDHHYHSGDDEKENNGNKGIQTEITSADSALKVLNNKQSRMHRRKFSLVVIGKASASDFPMSAMASRRRSIYEISSPEVALASPFKFNIASHHLFDYDDDPLLDNFGDWVKMTRRTKCPTRVIEQLLVKGVPKRLRGHVWKYLASKKLEELGRLDEMPQVTHEEYDNLLEEARLTNSEYYKVIKMDVGRTFPEHSFFSGDDSKGQKGLYNVLVAYSRVDSEVGYCQGIGFIAGILLLHCSSEFEAFELLIILMFGFKYRTTFLPSMRGLHLRLYQLTRLIDTKLPAILEHVIINDTMPDLFASPWFVTVLASQFPIAFVVRIYDFIFYGGFEMLFRVIHCMLSINEEELLEARGFEGVMDFFRPKLSEKCLGQSKDIFAQVLAMESLDAELEHFSVEYEIYNEEKQIQPDVTSNEKTDRHFLGATPSTGCSSEISMDSGIDRSTDCSGLSDAGFDDDAMARQLTGALTTIDVMSRHIEHLQQVISDKDAVIAKLETLVTQFNHS